MLGGCGVGPGTQSSHTQLLITQGFGAEQIATNTQASIPSGATVLTQLQANAKAAVSGYTVTSIDGATASGTRAWSEWINGVAPTKSATRTKLYGGDHVWWDLHDQSAVARVPDVVGAFPEPFLDGVAGLRFPTRIECTSASASDCSAVAQALAGYGIPAAQGGLELAEYNLSLRVIVGTWASMRTDSAALLLADAPSRSGVYARFVDGGAKLELYDAAGKVVQTVGAGSGIVAATQLKNQPPVWFVAGTDAAGVAAAVQLFNADTLHGHFAVAVANDVGVPLPVSGS